MNDPADDGTSQVESTWRKTLQQRVRQGDGCADRLVQLEASRNDFRERTPRPSRSRLRTWLPLLIAFSIPTILYAELTTPFGTTNYLGMAVGLVLMIAGSLSYA